MMGRHKCSEITIVIEHLQSYDPGCNGVID